MQNIGSPKPRFRKISFRSVSDMSNASPFLPCTHKYAIAHMVKSFLMPLFLMGCFPVDFQEIKRPLRTKSGKRPIKVGKRPIKEGKRPIKATVLVGISAGCLMGCFQAPRRGGKRPL